MIKYAITVEDLIKQLKKFPMDAQVFLEQEHDYPYPISMAYEDYIWDVWTPNEKEKVKVIVVGSEGPQNTDGRLV